MYIQGVPKLIDHDQRRRDVADAAWRIIGRDGLLDLSVRNVAEEAGLATASLRRSFPTQDDLRAFCLEHAAERVVERLERIDPQLSPREYCEASLRELLPLTDESRLEMEVQMSLGALAFTNAAMRVAYDRAHQYLAAGCRRLVNLLAENDTDYASLSDRVPDEARRLHAFLDGLALHLVHAPHDENRAWAEAELAAHLDSLRGP
ncbi:hypothetical protein ASG69_16605 [Rhodococcus sp. Leaf225]|nr:hypothetical protein ASG69_16605 [Rhodococcus sp. Leaf225]KQU48518.1 hypothetical protein ASH03_01080 [Rhodococcus sp. Leaf258]